MKAATGRASPTDAGTLVTLQWPAPATPSELGLDYFQQAQLTTGAVSANRFSVASTFEAEAEFSALGGGFSFTVSFPEPDRLGLGGCKGRHGGMADQVELTVAVSPVGPPTDAGTRSVSTSADISLGAY
jgi:hypothetical protein